MIVASFDGTRSAAVGGVYQYDMGQRLVMHGIPSPQELAKQDEMLSGDLVTVQAQFSYIGDSQAQMRLAMWDEARKAWLTDIPDEYLTRSRDVHVYVYLYYGADGDRERAQTVYQAVFCPIGRPAPSGVVTEEQKNQWNDLKDEIEISMARVSDAIDSANRAAEDAEIEGERALKAAKDAADAAQTAEEAKDEMIDAVNKIGNAVGLTSLLSADSEATASIDLTGDIGKLSIGTPRGKAGQKGETGEDGPADIMVEFDSATKTLTITTIVNDEKE